MISQGRGMAERNVTRVQQARDQLRTELGFSVADEIETLDRLKKSGPINQDEFVRLLPSRRFVTMAMIKMKTQ